MRNLQFSVALMLFTFPVFLQGVTIPGPGDHKNTSHVNEEPTPTKPDEKPGNEDNDINENKKELTEELKSFKNNIPTKPLTHEEKANNFLVVITFWAQALHQIVTDIMTDLNPKVRAKITALPRPQARAQVGAQTRAKIWAQTRAKIRAQVGAQFGVQVLDKVWAQVWDQLMVRVGDSWKGNPLLAQVGGDQTKKVWAQIGGDQITFQVSEKLPNLPFELAEFGELNGFIKPIEGEIDDVQVKCQLGLLKYLNAVNNSILFQGFDFLNGIDIPDIPEEGDNPLGRNWSEILRAVKI